MGVLTEWTCCDYIINFFLQLFAGYPLVFEIKCDFTLERCRNDVIRNIEWEYQCVQVVLSQSSM